jgi:hypothetical protein
MQPRTRSVAAALLLTASLAGTSLATGSADAASGLHAAARGTHVAARPAAPLTVHINAYKHRVTRSRTDFRPGNTFFTVASKGGGGTIEILQLRDGYTLNMLRKDFGGLFNGDLHAIRRIDRKAEFYAGTEIDRTRTLSFATFLDAGRYLIANLDNGTVTWMRVSGATQDRPIPRPTGIVNMVLKGGENGFANPDTRHPAGWMRTTNKTHEPHFLELNRVKWSTTPRKVQHWMDNPEGDPSWGLEASAGTLVVGPGHTVLWKYDLPAGKYLEMCWWPDEDTGQPHAMMGMWQLTKLVS